MRLSDPFKKTLASQNCAQDSPTNKIGQKYLNIKA